MKGCLDTLVDVDQDFLLLRLEVFEKKRTGKRSAE
jgi:hypothetical protein